MADINKMTEKWTQAINYDRDFSMINTYVPEGKHEIIAMVADILKKETKARVDIIDSETDEPFVIARLVPENAEFRLLLEGHLDVVSPEGMEHPFDGIIEDGWLKGRGVSDMKGGAGAILAAFIAAANEPGLKAELYLMYSTDEEYSGNEIKKALSQGLIPKVDFAIIGEPTDLKLTHVHKGEAWADVEFFGRSAHSSTPKRGINAVYMASAYIEKLRKFIEKYDAEVTEYGTPTMNVGVIQGGSTPNVVPPYAKIQVDIRYLPGQEYNRYEDDLKTVLEECRAEWPEVDGKITITGNWNSLYTDRENPVLKRMGEVLEKSLDIKIEYGMMTGWGEGGYINMFGIPTVYFGPGEGRFSHAPNEMIEISKIAMAAEGIYQVIRELCF